MKPKTDTFITVGGICGTIPTLAGIFKALKGHFFTSSVFVRFIVKPKTETFEIEEGMAEYPRGGLLRVEFLTTPAPNNQQKAAPRAAGGGGVAAAPAVPPSAAAAITAAAAALAAGTINSSTDGWV